MGVNRFEEITAVPYVDAELERLLQESKENDYANIIALLDLISQKSMDSKKEYDANNTQLNLQRKNYYFTILIESVINYMYRLFFGNPFFSSTTKEQFATKQAELQKWLGEHDSEYLTQAGQINEILSEVSRLKTTIATMESELFELALTIETLETDAHPDNEREKLQEHLDNRQALTQGVIGLYLLIDEEMAKLNQLTDLPSIDRKNYAAVKLNKEQQSVELAEKTIHINHPVAEKLQHFLTYKTPASLDTLRDTLGQHPDYLENRSLADSVWATGTLYPEVTKGFDREKNIATLIDIKEQDIATLSASLQEMGEQCQHNPSLNLRDAMNETVMQRDVLTQEIHKLLLANHTILSSDSLLGKLEDLAQSRIENNELAMLRERCMPIKHPASIALQDFLTYQTSVSLKMLRELMIKDDSYQDHPQLEDAIWAAGRLYPELTEGIQTKRQLIASELENAYNMQASLSEELHDLQEDINRATGYDLSQLSEPSAYTTRETIGLLKKHNQYESYQHLVATKKALFTVDKSIQALLHKQENLVSKPVQVAAKTPDTASVMAFFKSMVKSPASEKKSSDLDDKDQPAP